MFDYFNGILSDIYDDELPAITVDVAGVGYSLFISKKDFYILPDVNSSLKIFSFLIHKEDSMILYGFLNKNSRDIFKLLTSVSGVGPKMAMQILNEFDFNDILSFIANDEPKALTSAKGVGIKLAQKIVLELKDKVSKYNILPVNNINNSFNPNSQEINDASEVLLSLGYEKEEIDKAINSLMPSLSSDLDAENILKLLLKHLSE